MAVGGIFTAESSTHLVFGDLTMNRCILQRQKLAAKLVYEYDIFTGS